MVLPQTVLPSCSVGCWRTSLLRLARAEWRIVGAGARSQEESWLVAWLVAWLFVVVLFCVSLACGIVLVLHIPSLKPSIAYVEADNALMFRILPMKNRRRT